VPAPTGEIAGSAIERVAFGEPAAEAIVREAARLGSRRVFILASHHLATQTDEIDKIEAALGARHAATETGIRPPGPKSDVVRAAGVAMGVRADLIVSVGGGSVTDAGKIIPLCLKHDVRTVADLDPLRIRYDAQGKTASSVEAPDIRAVCVPTTLSGGEFNSLSGAYDETERRKDGFDHRLLAPIAVVLDPRLTLHTPLWLWLSTGVRALDHAVETLVSDYSNDFFNGLAESALRLLSKGLHRVKVDSSDTAARLMCQFGAWQSMIPVVGGVPMGASHAIGHLLGAVSNVSHGYTSCVMCPVVQRWNADATLAAQRRISACLGEPDRPAHELLKALIGSLGMPQTLHAVGVSRADLPRIAVGTLRDIWGQTNPRPLRGAEDVMELLAMAYAD
jgi:maleylacetate reductase